MNKYILGLIIFLTSLLSLNSSVRASHIVGGEVTYTCLGNDKYLITISIYRDCIGGLQGAIANDDPAYITVFTPNGKVYQSDQINAIKSSGEELPPNFKNECVNNPPATCLNKIVFQKSYYLPGGPVGYKILYQNCCRNRAVNNIINPANTGATYYCTIPPSTSADCNNSAYFKNYPPQIICVNNPLVYDHSAIDPDGDSLSYEFCMSYDSPEKQNPKTYPLFTFDPVVYRSPYTPKNPMGGKPQVTINATTGMISGTPNIQGRYVVAVCCNEWRNGVIINTVTREFQFVVTNCSKSVVANIPQYSDEFNTYIVNCKDYTVKFDNWSTGGSNYNWDFGDTNRTDDTSTAFSPTYTYPDSGVYRVTLHVNKGSTCSDSISRFVKVYPKLLSSFTAPNRICPGAKIDFINTSTSTYPITQYLWNFDDNNNLSSLKEPSHQFMFGGLYNVGLICINSKGCVDTFFKKIVVDPLRPNVGSDTTIVVGEKIQFNGQDIGRYSWYPSQYLSDTGIRNPIGTYPNSGAFHYYIKVVTEAGCISYDTVLVNVINTGHALVPNAFTPNGDGRNDVVRPLMVGFKEISTFKIFNRYGELVFSTNTIGDGWDGTYKGQTAEMGVFYWLLEAIDIKGNKVLEKGDVTLIR